MKDNKKPQSSSWKNFILFGVSICFVFLICCKNNDDDLMPPPPPPDPCPNLDSVLIPDTAKDSIFDNFECTFDWWEVYTERYLYRYPSFNPHNEYELAFYRKDEQEGTHALCVFNYCTNEFRILADNVWNHIEWGSKDWIIYTGWDLNLWKVKSNGDSLTRVTPFSGIKSEPKWNEEGDKFVFVLKTPDISNVVIDKNGVPLDTFYVPQLPSPAIASPTWLAGNLFAGVKGTTAQDYGFVLYDLETDEITELDIVGDRSIVLGTDWDANERDIYWITTLMIAKTNIDTKERTEFIQGSSSRWYRHGVSVSGDGSKVAVGRINRQKINDCEVATQNHIYIMNVDGSDERKLLIPE